MLAKYRKNKKSKSKQFSFVPLFIGILVLLAIGFLAFSGWRITKKRSELRAQIQDLQDSIQGLEEKKQALKSQAAQVSQESFWEKKIREQGYKKPGEEVAVILPPEQGGEEEKEKLNFFEKLLNVIKFW